MGKGSSNFMESPMEPVRTPTLNPTNKGISGGEDGYKKRTGGAFPEKQRETYPALKQPTKG
jgi:hypothetical protein